MRFVGGDDQHLVGQLQLRIVHDVLELVREVAHLVLGGDQLGHAAGNGGPSTGDFQLAGHQGLGAALLLAVNLLGQGQAPLADLHVAMSKGQFPVDALKLEQHVHDLAAEVLHRRVPTVRSDVNLRLVRVQAHVPEQRLRQFDHEVGRIARRGDERAVGPEVVEVLADADGAPGGELLGDSRADQPVVLHQGARAAGGQEATDRSVGVVETSPQEPGGIEDAFGQQDVRLGYGGRETGDLDVQAVLERPADAFLERQSDFAVSNFQWAGKPFKVRGRFLAPGGGLPFLGTILGDKLQSCCVQSLLRTTAGRAAPNADGQNGCCQYEYRVFSHCCPTQTTRPTGAHRSRIGQYC